jgi:hypothetical protein
MEIIFDLFNRHGFEMCIIAKNFAEQGPSKFFVSLKKCSFRFSLVLVYYVHNVSNFSV